MPEPAPRPPRWARRLARWGLPEEVAGPLVGDLEERWAARVRPRRGPLLADLWFWWQALTVRRRALRRSWRRLRAVRAAATSSHSFRAPSVPPSGTLPMILDDLRLALRRLVKNPAFTFVAILSLALGIGANTAMFSVVNSFLLRELPLEDPGRVVELYTSDSGGALYATSSYPDLVDLRREVGAFEGVVGSRSFLARLERAGEAEVVFGELVSGDFFRVLGVPMALGRDFLPEEDRTPGTHPVVVLGHRSWLERYGADPEILGRDVRLNGRTFTVVGVAPEGFTGSIPVLATGFYAPFMMTQDLMGWDGRGGETLERRGTRNLFVKARLAPGVTPEEANAQLEAFAQGVAEAHPETNEDRVYTAVPSEEVALHPFVDRILTPIAGLLLGVVGLVLLVACVNLASFLLARAEDRRREMAVRLALGAGRTALIRQLMVETTLLALVGGAAGWVAAQWTLDLVQAFRPPVPVPMDLVLGLDGRVLAFTAGVSLVAGLVFGLIPALQSTNPDLAPTLKDTGRGLAPRGRVRDVLVGAQVALSFVLLIGAGLFLRSLYKAQAIDPGFDTGAAAVVWPMPGMSGYDSAEEIDVLYRMLGDQLRSQPEVRSLAMTDRVPLGSQVMNERYRIPGMPSEGPEGLWSIDKAHVLPGYFASMGVELLQGRDFEEADLQGDDVVVVSQTFARRFFPDGRAVGRTVEDGGGNPLRIVGVAADTKVRSLGEEPRPYLYEIARAEAGLGLQLVVRGVGTSAELLALTRSVLEEVDPDLVLFEAKTMEEHLGFMLFAPRMAALLLGVFGGLALLLSAIGIYGVVSHAVARRTRELGIRMSLGATARDVVGEAVAGGLRPVAVGAAVGTLLAAALAGLLGDYLYGIAARDVGTFLAIALLLGAVALAAAWIPARAAARVDPVRALRTE